MGTVDDYLASLTDDDREVVAHTYEVGRAVVPDVTETTAYGMAALAYRGKPVLAVVPTRAGFSIYPFSGGAVDAVSDDLAGFDHSKGTIRFTAANPLPDDVVRRLLHARMGQVDC